MDLSLLNGMHRAVGADHRSGDRQGCLEGTRTDVLLMLEHWLADKGGKWVFWLNGLAGTGKSTIAQTFAETSSLDGKLGAGFFCSRGSIDRSNLKAIFPTIAFHLAYRYPLFRQELLKVLRGNPDAGHQSLDLQMKELIVGPLEATGIPTLIIIDALDECVDEGADSAILSVLSKHVKQIPNVRFFITGRPEPQIRYGFRLKPLQLTTEEFKLHEVEHCSVDRDIELFFRTCLTKIAKHPRHHNFTGGWPTTSDINILCKKATGLFVYASTVVKFVESQFHQPSERLALIVSPPQGTTPDEVLGIDLLYTQVLDHAFHGVDDERFYSHLKSVLGVVLLVFNPLPMETLSTLLGLSNIPTILDSLYSVLLVSDDEAGPIQVFHKSFPDFLTDSSRCKDKRFFVDPPVHHTELVLSCLNLMKKRLKKNICNLDDYAVLSEVEDLSIRQGSHIGDTLEYACCFWTRHLMKTSYSGQDTKEVQRAIDEFFTTYLLFWIEVLVIIGDLDVGVYAINDIQQWYTSVSHKVFVYQFLYS